MSSIVPRSYPKSRKRKQPAPTTPPTPVAPTMPTPTDATPLTDLDSADNVSDRIEREHFDAPNTYYDRRADFLASVALDGRASPKLAKRAMKRANEIFYTARVVAVPGGINVRQQVINVLRRIGA